jgi:hypothetical protein
VALLQALSVGETLGLVVCVLLTLSEPLPVALRHRLGVADTVALMLSVSEAV